MKDRSVPESTVPSCPHCHKPPNVLPGVGPLGWDMVACSTSIKTKAPNPDCDNCGGTGKTPGLGIAVPHTDGEHSCFCIWTDDSDDCLISGILMTRKSWDALPRYTLADLEAAGVERITTCCLTHPSASDAATKNMVLLPCPLCKSAAEQTPDGKMVECTSNKCKFFAFSFETGEWNLLPRYTLADITAAKRRESFHPGCNYTGWVGEICTKCGKMVEENSNGIHIFNLEHAVAQVSRERDELAVRLGTFADIEKRERLLMESEFRMMEVLKEISKGPHDAHCKFGSGIYACVCHIGKANSAIMKSAQPVTIEDVRIGDDKMENLLKELVRGDNYHANLAINYSSGGHTSISLTDTLLALKEVESLRTLVRLQKQTQVKFLLAEEAQRKGYAGILKDRDELRTVLEAWQRIFGSTQLTHAKDNYDAALSKAKAAGDLLKIVRESAKASFNNIDKILKSGRELHRNYSESTWDDLKGQHKAYANIFGYLREIAP